MIGKKDKNTTNNTIENLEERFEAIKDDYAVTQEAADEKAIIRQKANEIIAKYSQIDSISFDHAAIGICSLIQSGAYLKSVTNRKIRINNHDFSKKTLLYAAEQVGNKYTLRAIARSLQKIIAKIANNYNIPGNLYARYKLENATTIASNSAEENKRIAIYCTDFQLENPDTPTKVREYLANREKDRTNKNTMKP